MQDVRQLTSMETKCAQAQEFNFAVVMQTLQARAAEVAISAEALVARCFMQDPVAAAAVGQRLMHSSVKWHSQLAFEVATVSSRLPISTQQQNPSHLFPLQPLLNLRQFCHVVGVDHV
jgi:hypothetical protein